MVPYAQRFASVLTAAGAIPFVLCAAYFTLGVRTEPLHDQVQQLFCVYALIICSFVSGSHWGQHLALEKSSALSIAILSNLIALFLWISFLFMPYKGLLGLMAGAFLLQIGVDFRLAQLEMITHSYFRTRCYVTAVVVTTLFVGMWTA